MNSDREKLGAAFASTPECLPVDELDVVLEGRRGDEMRRLAEAHLVKCVHCKTELSLLREFENPTVRPEEQSDVKWIAARLRKNSPAAPAPWWKQLWNIRVLAPASLALVAGLIAIGIGLQSRHSVEGIPQTGGGEVMRSQSMPVTGPVGDVTTRPERLEWHAVPGARNYRVRVIEVDRTELWTTTVPETSVALNSAVVKQIVPLKTLMWEVSALDSAGTVISSSGLQSFRLVENAAH